jgi:Protein of unknown function (DUF2393)
MEGMLQPTATERDREWLPKLLGIAAILIVAAVTVFLLRPTPHPRIQLNPYAAQLKISDLKMNTAQNFVGAKVTYIDGTLTNPGDKIVTHAVVHVTFRDLYGQVAQIEDAPVKVLQTGGPYLDTIDLAASPLTPGQNKPFRLIFEHVSQQWNQAYPELQVTDAATK